MDNAIRIKCPSCGAVLTVRNTPGIEKKKVTCPICKKTHPFVDFTNASDPSTLRRPANKLNIPDSVEESTKIETSNFSIGRLAIEGTSIKYQMKPGRNIVGRRSRNSIADFQIDTGEERSMSRQHLLVEVKKVPNRGFVHYMSLCRANVNPTTINGCPMTFGIDCVILHNGDVIKLPGATLRFEIPDEDATEIR